MHKSLKSLKCTLLFNALVLCMACASAPEAKAQPLSKVRNNAKDAFEELDGPRKPKRGKKAAKARPKSQKNKRPKTTSSKSAVEFNGVDSLEANGIGDNESRAQTAATAALSRIILSRLDSTLTDRVSERNGKLNSSVTEETQVSTDITLKGVAFSRGKKVRGGLQVTATLSGEALAQTIDFLLKKTESKLEYLTPRELDGRLQALTHLRALLTIDLASGIAGRTTLAASVDDNYARTIKFRESGRIELRGVKPGDRVSIDDVPIGDIVKSNPVRQVTPGRHTIQVARQGFRTLVKETGVAKGRRQIVEFNFVPNKLGSKSLFIQIEPSADIISEAIPAAFRELGVSISPYSAKNAMRISIEVDRTKVPGGYGQMGNGTTKNEMVLVIESFKGPNSVRTSRAKEKFFSTRGDGGAAARKVARRLLRALSSKLLPFLAKTSFFNGPEYDYSDDPRFKRK